MSTTNPLELCSAEQIRRFAACYLNIKDKQAVNWDAAAAQFDPKVKSASFKTVTTKAFKKILDQAGIESGNESGTGTTSNNATPVKGKKRKAEGEDVNGSKKKAATPARAAGKGKGKGKKTVVAAADEEGRGSEVEIPVKSEKDAEGDSDANEQLSE